MIKKLSLLLLFILTLSSCAAPPAVPDGSLTAHFIDVGQGDSSLIVMPGGEVILIDAGSRNQGGNIARYITDLGINKIDFLIATHPHEDHIGGMPHIIENFDIGEIYMPDAVSTTRTFENLLDAIENAGLSVNIAEAGVVFINGDAAAEFISPAEEFNDLNNMSAVALISFGSARFLFTGDAEAEAERAMLKNPGRLRADVLKAGHHGSNTSSTEDFLAAVRPSIAVISCGADNTYGHPAPDALDRLSAYAHIFRTDTDGTVVITTDGESISVLR